MKIHINWGKGILIFIILFFLAAFTFIYFSFLQKSDLVDERYYPKEIEYQKQIERVRNFEQLGEELRIQIKKKGLFITFPASHMDEITGEIHIYRPSDASLDKKIAIKADRSNQQIVSVNNLKRGKYILKIAWKCNNIEYYQERTIIIE